MRAIDLNSDLGESFGAYRIGMDPQVMEHITSANVACGWHGGDPLVMEQTVAEAKAKGVRVGAHPSFPDQMGFGRREMQVTPEEAYAYVKYQIGALYAFTRAAGVELQHVKGHGAIYNMACKDIKLATAMCRAVRDFDRQLIMLAPAQSMLHQAAEELGVPFAGEFFADRAYNSDGSLVSRRLPGAMVTDAEEACRRVLQMAQEGTVTCIDGTVLPVRCHSVCVHGDNAHAVETVKQLRASLEAAGIAIRPLSELI